MAKTKGYTLMLSISFWSSAYHGVSRSCARGPCSDSSGLPSLARNTSSWPWDLCSTSPASYTTAAVQQPIQQGILSVNILDEKDTTRSDVVLMMWSWEPSSNKMSKPCGYFSLIPFKYSGSAWLPTSTRMFGPNSSHALVSGLVSIPTSTTSTSRRRHAATSASCHRTGCRSRPWWGYRSLGTAEVLLVDVEVMVLSSSSERSQRNHVAPHHAKLLVVLLIRWDRWVTAPFHASPWKFVSQFVVAKNPTAVARPARKLPIDSLPSWQGTRIFFMVQNQLSCSSGPFNQPNENWGMISELSTRHDHDTQVRTMVLVYAQQHLP